VADSAASDVPSAIVPGEVRESPPSGTRQQGKIPIETMVRSVAIVGALFYVLGFLTTNAYLYKLGVSDFSLLRTRFILTGVLTLAPVVLALIGGIYAALDATLHGSHTRLTSRAYLWILADIALPFALYFTLFSVVAENDVGASARDAALLSAVCAVLVLALLVSLALYRKSERRPLSHLAYRGKPVSYDRFTERFGVPSGVVETTIFAVAGVVLFLAYIGLFGQYFYPTLPEQLGGGRPRMAQILVTGEAVPAVRELGLDVTEDAPLSPLSSYSGKEKRATSSVCPGPTTERSCRSRGGWSVVSSRGKFWSIQKEPSRRAGEKIQRRCPVSPEDVSPGKRQSRSCHLDLTWEDGFGPSPIGRQPELFPHVRQDEYLRARRECQFPSLGCSQRSPFVPGSDS
jgi:hypothetical protein